MLKWLLFLGITLTACSDSTKPSSSLQVMTFNIRYDASSDVDNPWSIRKNWVAQVIQFHDADIIGVQEALEHQVNQLNDLLPAYSWLGNGRDDGKTKGEYVPIFYKKNRFDLLDSGQFWLSKNPTKPGSKSWDAAITRMVTWAYFKDKSTGKLFYFYNTHFDHVGQKSREEAAKIILAAIKKRVTTHELVILGGDFNIRKKNAAYKTLTTELTDAATISELPPYGPSYTFTGFQPTGTPDNIIDFIFLKNRKGVKVLRHGKLSDNWDGKYPSDHLPVLVELGIEN